MTTDDLDPQLNDALRSVPATNSVTRDAHIAAALEQTVTRRPQSGRIVVGAAAAIVLLLGVFAIGRSSVSSPQSPVVSAPASSIPKAALSSCTDQFDNDAELVHSYEVNDVDFAVVKVNDQTFILEVNSCTYITQFSTAAD
jgi:hypothetical protein